MNYENIVKRGSCLEQTCLFYLFDGGGGILIILNIYYTFTEIIQ